MREPERPPQNGLTPLHVAAHYDNQKVALLLLEKGASPHATAKVRTARRPQTHARGRGLGTRGVARSSSRWRGFGCRAAKAERRAAGAGLTASALGAPRLKRGVRCWAARFKSSVDRPASVQSSPRRAGVWKWGPVRGRRGPGEEKAAGHGGRPQVSREGPEQRSLATSCHVAGDRRLRGLCVHTRLTVDTSTWRRAIKIWVSLLANL